MDIQPADSASLKRWIKKQLWLLYHTRAKAVFGIGAEQARKNPQLNWGSIKTYSTKKTSCVKIEVVWRPHD